MNNLNISSPFTIQNSSIHDRYIIYIRYIDLLHLPKKYIQTVKVLYVLYVGPPQGTWRYAGASWSGQGICVPRSLAIEADVFRGDLFLGCGRELVVPAI